LGGASGLTQGREGRQFGGTVHRRDARAAGRGWQRRQGAGGPARLAAHRGQHHSQPGAGRVPGGPCPAGGARRVELGPGLLRRGHRGGILLHCRRRRADRRWRGRPGPRQDPEQRLPAGLRAGGRRLATVSAARLAQPLPAQHAGPGGQRAQAVHRDRKCARRRQV
ncbi:hypothetical protein TSOC_014048, partial [Tetrabaena socialis]